MRSPIIEPLIKLIPTIKPIGKLTVLLIKRLILFLLELFCKPIINIKNKEELNMIVKNDFFNIGIM